MKMREALENIAGYAEIARCHTEDVHILSFLGEIEGWARAALSAPPRQCDVGTPGEQKKRMLEYCKTHKNKDGIIICADCPMHDANLSWCTLEWVQTPYAKEGVAK